MHLLNKVQALTEENLMQWTEESKEMENKDAYITKLLVSFEGKDLPPRMPEFQLSNELQDIWPIVGAMERNQCW